MGGTQVFRSDLHKLVDQLPVVVFEYTFFPEGYRGFTYISPRCEELLGLRPETIMEGRLSIDNFIHPDDLGAFHTSVEQSVQTVSEWSWKGRCKGRKGYSWIETKSSPIQKEDGRIVYHGIISDITETKELEDRQRFSESRYRNLVEQLPLGIVIHSDGIIRFANAHAARLIGAQDPSELLGREALQFVHPDLRSIAKERIASILSGQQVPPMETRFLRLDGKEIIVNSAGNPYVYEGQPAVQVIFADITDRKAAEAGYLRAETLFFELFKHTPLAIVLLNERSEVVQVNKGFEALFGYTLDELAGKILTEAIVPAELEQEGNEINSLITENKVIRVETVRRRKDGQDVSVIIYGVPVVLGEKKIGIFGMYVDITERQRMEEELKIRNAELDNFVYKVSHDLRAPLSSVLGLAHLAAMPGNRDDLSAYVRLMGEKALQLDHFISDVLSHSKNLKMEVTVDRVDVREIIHKTFTDLSFLTGAEEIRKRIIVTGTELYSDQWRLGEIFRNLISNAIKYRKLNYPEAEVRVEVKVTERACEIVVADNGIGVDKGFAPRIFEMFFRASDRSDGSGLGLYIVKNAVDRLAGTIEVESETGLGTTFRIVLPNLIGK
ncbi:MAG: PAS domain S-box protein [Cyclobacteriaceae bacterium]|nr:PAS domain S-box protein [Cyclobacteriaceae bacterium]